MKKQNATTLFQSPFSKMGRGGSGGRLQNQKEGTSGPRSSPLQLLKIYKNENSQGVFLDGIGITVELAGILIVF